MKNVKSVYKKMTKCLVVMICLITSFLFISGITVEAAKVAGLYEDWRYDINTRRNVKINYNGGNNYV